jgi:hypothetical protein
MLTTRGSAVAVVGSDPVSTGAAALDVARAAARQQRPVLVVDLIGEASGLEGIILTHDDHGVADCFLYGVSFRAVSRPTAVDPRITVIPAGTEPIPYAEALPSGRWTHLFDETRDNGSVVVVAAREDTPELETLTSQVDRVIRPSESEFLATRPANVGGPVTPLSTESVALPKPRRPLVNESAATKPDASQGASPAASQSASTRAPKRQRVRMVGPSKPTVPRIRRRVLLGVGGALAALAIVGVSWAAIRRRNAMTEFPATARTDTVTSTAQLGARDGATAASRPDASASEESGPPVIDPADSSRVAGFAVRVGEFGTYAEALRVLRRDAVRWGGATIAPLPASTGAIFGSAPQGRVAASHFIVYAGAGNDAGSLTDLEHRMEIAGTTGTSVAHTPFALRIATAVSLDSARRTTISLRGRGLPVYALVDERGQAAVYAGAFASPPESLPLSASLHAVGLSPVLAYRVGHPL